MSVSRRATLIGALGLAPASAVALESFVEIDGPGVNAGEQCTKEKIAAALRNLADQIEAKKVVVATIDVHSKAHPNEIIKHTIAIDVFYNPVGV